MNDFDDIMAKADGSNTTQTKKPFDKSAWIEKKQQERQEVYDLMDKTADEVKVYKNNDFATVYFANPVGRPPGIAIDFKVGQKRTHGYYELQSTDFDEIAQDIEDTLSNNFKRMEESTRVKASLKYLRECGYIVTKKQ